MAKYWASCSPGLEFALRAELERLEHTEILQDALIFGGVVFSTLSAATEVLKLRSADNVHAFVGNFQGVPLEKEAAVHYLKGLAQVANWDSSLELFGMWKALDCSDAAVKFDKYSPLAFRVSCDRACVTMRKHGYTSMESAAALGAGVYERFGWRADMCFYDLEILAWIRDDEILLGLALLQRGIHRILVQHREGSQELMKTGDPEHNVESMGGPAQRSSRASHAISQLYAWRAYRKALVKTSLKPSVAHAMLQLGSILPGSIILDPMCGGATIPLEASESLGSGVYCMAGDIAMSAMDASLENVNAPGACVNCDIMQWNASNLPMRNGVVDRIVCDMPFGIRCGTSRSRDSICPKVLREIIRILKIGTGVAVLLGQSKVVRHELETNLQPYLKILQSLPIQMEGLRVEILVIQRTGEPHRVTQTKGLFLRGKHCKR